VNNLCVYQVGAVVRQRIRSWRARATWRLRVCVNRCSKRAIGP